MLIKQFKNTIVNEVIVPLIRNGMVLNETFAGHYE
jgi:hypothetical protein